VLAAVLTLGGAVGPALARGAPAVQPGASAGHGAGALQVFSKPPVLVRAGETVRIPVDASCSTDQGASCGASVTFSVLERGAPWREFAAPARPDLAFDLTAPAARAVDGAGSGAAGSGSVAYVIRGRDDLGRTMRLPPAGESAPLRLYVVVRMRTIPIPTPAFGRTVRGVTVLSLPWGTGPDKAGLAPGNESPTLGPSSFDVDARGRIYLMDNLQGRLGVFDGGRLVSATSLDVAGWADVSLAGDGSAYVLTRLQGNLQVQRVDPTGRPAPPVGVGGAIPSEIGTAGDRVFVHALPIDAWVPLGGGSDAAAVRMGRPLADGGELLRVVGPRSLRLGLLRHGKVANAVELSSSVDLGEVSLAQPDGRGGYVAVLHVWRQTPTPADQYQVIHVLAGGGVTAFCVPNAGYAQAAALSTFRLGADGHLYHLTSGSAGVRVVRYQIGGMA